MRVISEKSKIDSQISDIIHKCSLYESTLQNKDKIIDDLRIQFEVLNEGTTQKLKNLDKENKKNLKMYNDTQAELIKTKKEMIQQKQNYEIEIHNLKSEKEKDKEIAIREKQEATIENSRLESEKLNLKKKLSEIENEKDILKINRDEANKKLKELEGTNDSTRIQNEILQKKNSNLEQQIELNNQEKILIKKKFQKELMKLKKIGQEYKNSLENIQNKYEKDIIEYVKKNKNLMEKLEKQELHNENKYKGLVQKIENQDKKIQEYKAQIIELEQNIQKLK
ncbi:hypothetical protein U3516DRAFT_668439 [Neocallimastix sp. 'constans']